MCPGCEKSLPNQIVFDKAIFPAKNQIELIIRLMQDEQNGLTVKTAKSFMSKIPSVFTGTDLIQWMMKNLPVDDQQEAIHLANLIASHGYIFPIEDHTLTIKNDATFYRFQTPCLWPSNNLDPENTDYAVYLCKRTMQGKARLELADYEAENLARLQKMFSRKWEFIFMQAESQAKVDKKRDKLERKVLDSQERAFWDVYRPVPGCVNTTELDIKKACRLSKSAKRCSDCQKVASSGTGASSGSGGGSVIVTSPSPTPLTSRPEQQQSHRQAAGPVVEPHGSSVAKPLVKQQTEIVSSEGAEAKATTEETATTKTDKDKPQQQQQADLNRQKSTSSSTLKSSDEPTQVDALSEGAAAMSPGRPVEQTREQDESDTKDERPHDGPNHRKSTSSKRSSASKSKRQTSNDNEPSRVDKPTASETTRAAPTSVEAGQDQPGDTESSVDNKTSKTAAHQQHQQHPHAHAHHHHHHHHHHPHQHQHSAHSHHGHAHHHHHHHHRSCPHHHKQQQAAGDAQAQTQAGHTKCSASKATCPGHKKRTSGSVDHLGPNELGKSTSSASCSRRKSECQTKVARSCEKHQVATGEPADKSQTEKPAVNVSERLEVEASVVGSQKQADVRPASACSSFASLGAQTGDSSKDHHQHHQQAINPSPSPTQMLRKSSLNILGPPSGEVLAGPTASTSAGSAHLSATSFRKASVHSQGGSGTAAALIAINSTATATGALATGRSQLKGTQSVCAGANTAATTTSGSSQDLTAINAASSTSSQQSYLHHQFHHSVSLADRQNICDLERELETLRVRLDRGGVKMSKVTQSYLSYFKQWAEYDPFIAQPIPSNPWQSDSTELWDSERQTKDVHCRRVRRWAFSLKELLNDPAGREQFHRFLEKEFSAENLKFWDAVQELKRVHARDVARQVEAIWTEYLAQDANCPINIDSKSYETSKKNMAKNKSNRYIFDEAAGHVYQLMKNDSYPRYLRSDMYKDYKELSERRRPNQVAFDVFKPQINTLKHKFNF